MKELELSYYFKEINEFRFKDVFKNCKYPWEALANINTNIMLFPLIKKLCQMKISSTIAKISEIILLLYFFIILPFYMLNIVAYILYVNLFIVLMYLFFPIFTVFNILFFFQFGNSEFSLFQVSFINFFRVTLS